MTSPHNFYVCPGCEYGWDISKGKNCPVCGTEGEPADGDE